MRRTWARHRNSSDPDQPGNWREILLVSWAGRRAVVTVATALALPEEFPSRGQVTFVAVVVALVTLLLPGLTLPWLVRVLGMNFGIRAAAGGRAGSLLKSLSMPPRTGCCSPRLVRPS